MTQHRSVSGPRHDVEPAATVREPEGTSPGKQTLTMLQPAVQAKLDAGAVAGAHSAEPPPAAGPGSALPAPLHARVHDLFGPALSGVRLHVDDAPAAVGAKGFARGDDIHIAPAHYAPETPAGQALIGHELAHVQQQRDGRVASAQGKGGTLTADPGLEAEADAIGDRFAHGEPARATSTAGGASGGGAVQAKLEIDSMVALIRAPLDEVKEGALEPVFTAIAHYNAKETVERLQAVQAAVHAVPAAKQRKYLAVLDQLARLVEREFNDLATRPPSYPEVLHATPGPDEQRTIGNAELNQAIQASLPDASDADQVWQALQVLVPDDKQGFLPRIQVLLQELADVEGDEQVQGLRAFLGVYQTKKAAFPTKPTAILPILFGVLKKGQENRASRPKITVTGAPLATADTAQPQLGMAMADVERGYDVLARKSSAPPPHAVAEVDLAFLEDMRGIPDFRAMLEPANRPPSLTGGDGRNEKVFAIGHAQSLAFAGKLSNKGGERYYGVLYPKGWVDRYGVDLKTAGVSGKSAATPTDQDFASGEMIDGDQKSGNTKAIAIPSDKAFAIRAEDATPQGQVHLHMARTNMEIHGKPMSQLDFFRASSVGVAEFDGTGKVIALRMW